MIGHQRTNCLAYVQRQEAEHRELNELLGEVGTMVQRRATMPVTPLGALNDEGNVRTALARVRGHLARHFAEEEEGGCLEEAACRVPGLGGEVRQIEAEHGLILGTLDELILKEERRGIAPEDFDRFVAAIRDHEAREDHVLERGFNLALEA
jgi:hypothetical protein